MAKNARVVKAFNTTGAGNMANPRYGGRGLTMFYATDDESAKAIAEKLIATSDSSPNSLGR